MDSFEKMEMEFQKIHSALNSDLPSKIIYHYTDFDGFENIIKEKTLRYTDYQCFNDPTEIKFGSSLILSELLYRRIIHPGGKNIIALFSEFDKFCHLYVACFSEKIEKLSLWRYYASNGTGFAIGFNKNFFKIEDLNKLGIATIGKIKYGEKRVLKIIKSFCEIYENYRGHSEIFKICLISHLVSLFPIFKDDSFEDEHEIRMSYMEGELIIDPNTGKSFYFDDDRKKVIYTNSQNYRFSKVQQNKRVVLLEKFCESDISEIRIGPSCNFLEARLYIRNLLKENGYDINKIEIKPSKLPFLSE